jgi:hypothetical protein
LFRAQKQAKPNDTSQNQSQSETLPTAATPIDAQAEAALPVDAQVPELTPESSVLMKIDCKTKKSRPGGSAIGNAPLAMETDAQKSSQKTAMPSPASSLSLQTPSPTAALNLPAAKATTPQPVDVEVLSDFGVTRRYERRALAQAILEALPEDGCLLVYTALCGLEQRPSGVDSAPVVKDITATTAPKGKCRGKAKSKAKGSDGALSGKFFLTSAPYFQAQVTRGFVMCEMCGRFVCRDKGGLAWHVKTAHGVTSHAEAYDRVCRSYKAVVLRTADVPCPHGDAGGSAAMAVLDPHDLERAMNNEVPLKQVMLFFLHHHFTINVGLDVVISILFGHLRHFKLTIFDVSNLLFTAD